MSKIVCFSCRKEVCPMIKGLCECLQDANKALEMRNLIMITETCVHYSGGKE